MATAEQIHTISQFLESYKQMKVGKVAMKKEVYRVLLLEVIKQQLTNLFQSINLILPNIVNDIYQNILDKLSKVHHSLVLF